ncbi:hypothetical protein TNCV_53171 [Trichonephila clavipes]|nr:hypothetical protein TNCV_53171 [Trichonephila clavipes]
MVLKIHFLKILSVPELRIGLKPHFLYRRQEEEPMDWEDVPFLPEVSTTFFSTYPPRKMRSLISAQIILQTEGGVSLHSRGCPEGLLKRAASRNHSSRPPSGVPRATLFFERYLRTIATVPTLKLIRQVGNPDFACVVSGELAAKCFVSYNIANKVAIIRKYPSN